MFISLFFFQSDSPVKRYLVLGKYNMFQLLFIEDGIDSYRSYKEYSERDHLIGKAFLIMLYLPKTAVQLLTAFLCL